MSQSNRILILLLIIDISFVFIHFYFGLWDSAGYLNSRWSLYTDMGFAAIFQHLKEAWIIFMFCRLAVRKSRFFFSTWAMIFGYILVDDFVRIHEKYGYKVAIVFNYTPMMGLAAQDFGEIMVFAFFGLFFLVLIGVVYLRSNDNLRGICRRLSLILIMLALFGVAFDAILASFEKSGVSYEGIWLGWPDMIGKFLILGLIIVEEAGEMIILSLACWYVFSLTKRAKEM